MPVAYVEVEVRTDSSLAEELGGVLAQLGFEGFWEEPPFLRCYIRSDRWDDRMEAEVRRVVGLIIRPSTDALPSISIRVIPEENWNARWEATIQPVRVSRRIVIAPTWQPFSAQPGDIVLTIDPKMAFGTGYHESTRLILRMLEDSVRSGSTVLDVGTGTGVLAIAAVRLGAASAVGVDPDEWSYQNALENVRLNGVAAQVDIRQGDIQAAPEGPFDVIAANIQRSIIEPIIGAMLARLAPAGLILLSGLLRDDREPMTTALRAAGLSVGQTLEENEWIALSVSRA